MATKYKVESALEDVSGAQRVIDVTHSAVHEGILHTAQKTFTALANDGKTYIEIRTPADEEVHLKAAGVGTTAGPVKVRLVEAPTITPGSTPIAPTCRNRNESDDDEVLFFSDATGVSGGTQLGIPAIIGGSGVGQSIASGGASLSLEWELKKGTTYVVEFENKSGGAVDGALELTYYLD